MGFNRQIAFLRDDLDRINDPGVPGNLNVDEKDILQELDVWWLAVTGPNSFGPTVVVLAVFRSGSPAHHQASAPLRCRAQQPFRWIVRSP